MSTTIPYELRIHKYRGPKKPPMLTGSANKIILPLKIMAHTVIAKQRAMHNDFEFSRMSFLVKTSQSSMDITQNSAV